MNIRVDLNYPINDGTEVVFRSPVDCSQITGLIVYYPENGITASKEFALADAHGNNVGDIDHLFAENVAVKVILDVTTGMAFVQNADTNAYLEGRFEALENAVKDKPYELIDTITLTEDATLNLTQEPDGTPYKFDRIMVLCDRAANSFTSGCELWVKFPNTSSSFVIGGWDKNNNKTACYAEVFCHNGYWRGETAINTNFFIWTTFNITGYNRITQFDKGYKSPYIKSIHSDTLPAGSVIKIYAIRYEGE